MQPLYNPCEARVLALLGKDGRKDSLLEQAGRRGRGVWGQSDPAVETPAVGDFLAPGYFAFDIHASRIIKIAPGHWARGSDPRPSSPIQTPVLRPRHARRP